MRTAPSFMGFLYVFMGFLFTFFAIQQVSNFGWNLWAILLMALAAFDFYMAFRYFSFQRKMRNKD